MYDSLILIGVLLNLFFLIFVSYKLWALPSISALRKKIRVLEAMAKSCRETNDQLLVGITHRDAKIDTLQSEMREMKRTVRDMEWPISNQKIIIDRLKAQMEEIRTGRAASDGRGS